MMRKWFALLLALNYSLLSSGAASLLHYCRHDGGLHLEHFTSDTSRPHNHESCHSTAAPSPAPESTHSCCAQDAPASCESEQPASGLHASVNADCCVSSYTALPSFFFEPLVLSFAAPLAQLPAVPTAEEVPSHKVVLPTTTCLKASEIPRYLLYSSPLYYS